MATSMVLMAALVLGAFIGHRLSDTGQWLGTHVDQTLLVLVCLLFFGVQLGALWKAAGRLRFIALALVTNFVCVPLIGYGVASLFLSAHPLLMVGLVIYFMSPCTDWFLGFTRLAGGNVALGTALIPINMGVQLSLFPLYLQWLTHRFVHLEAGMVADTMLQWFLLPLAVAAIAHYVLRRILGSERFERVLHWADRFTLWVIALLILQIFAGNIPVILEHRAVFAWLLLAVFVFFVLTFVLGEGLGRVCRLNHADHALLTMTLAARNAPLMLALTMVALPEQPLVYAAIVIGMLVEFPHLTVLRLLLLRSLGRGDPVPPSSGMAHPQI